MLTATTTKSQNILLWFAPSLFTVALLVVAIVTASHPRAPLPGWIPGIVGLAMAWFAYVSVPRRITVNGERLILERPIGNISIPIVEVRRVNASQWNRGFVIVAAKKRRIFLLRNTRNLFAIVVEIKRQNPSAVVIGDVPHAA